MNLAEQLIGKYIYESEFRMRTGKSSDSYKGETPVFVWDIRLDDGDNLKAALFRDDMVHLFLPDGRHVSSSKPVRTDPNNPHKATDETTKLIRIAVKALDKLPVIRDDKEWLSRAYKVLKSLPGWTAGR